jgi:hypothetical protein
MTDLDDENTLPTLNIIVFSKDRACQLDLFLRSMQKMLNEFSGYNITILYTSSNKDFEKGYHRLKKEHADNIHFTNEKHFKEDMLAAINASHDYTIFFVDDIVWKEPFSINCNEMHILKQDSAILCLSLRLDPGLNYCYALDIKMKPPEFDDKNCWQWKGKDGDFGYPMSVDGHIYRTADIYPLLCKLSYQNPNTLEGTLANHPIDRKKMICLKRAPIFNLPINKVQKCYENRHGSISADSLNKLFLSGKRISMENLIGFNNNACHQEVDVTLIKPEEKMIERVMRWLGFVK